MDSAIYSNILISDSLESISSFDLMVPSFDISTRS